MAGSNDGVWRRSAAPIRKAVSSAGRTFVRPAAQTPQASRYQPSISLLLPSGRRKIYLESGLLYIGAHLAFSTQSYHAITLSHPFPCSRMLWNPAYTPCSRGVVRSGTHRLRSPLYLRSRPLPLARFYAARVSRDSAGKKSPPRTLLGIFFISNLRPWRYGKLTLRTFSALHSQVQ